MKTFSEALTALLAMDEIAGVYWLVELDLPAGKQYFSESGIWEWDPGDGTVHTWNPFQDPDEPIGGVKQSLYLTEKNDTSINLCNHSKAISALIRTVDVEGRTARVYLYFPSIDDGILMFRGIMGKPEALKEGVVSIPIVTHVHGPRVKLPGDAFSTICRFATYFGDGENCFYCPAQGRGNYETGTTPYASCSGTSSDCADRGMRPAPAACGLTFAAAPGCPYDPANGKGLIDYTTGMPFTSCPKTVAACVTRDMQKWFSGNGPKWDNFAGFEKFNMTFSASYKSGFLGLGHTHYTSNSKCPDNFLGSAIPLAYGEVKMPGVNFFALDLNNCLLCASIFADGPVGGPQAGTDMLYNGAYIMGPFIWFTHGWIGQDIPRDYPQYNGDPFAGTAYCRITVPDEDGIQPSHDFTMTGHILGRSIRTWSKVDDDWVMNPARGISSNPIEVMADLFCNKRGGLRLGYGIINNALMECKGHADEVIADVDGVSRKRYTFNGYVMEQQPAADVLERIRKEFSMYFRLYGDTLDWGFLTDEMTSVYTFSEANHNLIVDDDGVAQVEISEKGAEDIPNRLYISFLDASNGWEKTTFHLESQEQIAKAGKVNDEQVFLLATTNIGQALRIGSNMFERMISGNYQAKWKSTLMALHVEVGDVVTLVTDLAAGGQQLFLVTGKSISAEFDIDFEGEIYRPEFYDDVVANTYEDSIREQPSNPFRQSDEVTIDSAAEEVLLLNGKRYSQITVDYTRPEDPIWLEAESWWRDVNRDPAGVWHSADVSRNGQASFLLLANEYRELQIALRSVSRYGVRRAIDNTLVPKVNMTVYGTTDEDVPDAPANLTVAVTSTSPEVPAGTYRVSFDAGGANWTGVHTLYLECNPTLPFSDGTVKTSNGQSVSGAAGSVVAGEPGITDATKDWTPDDADLVGCLAIVEDIHGHIQARVVTGNTATAIRTNGGYYRPTGTYAYRVITNFALENFRGFAFERGRGDFQAGQNHFTYDLPVSHEGLLFRVCAFNDFGMSAWAYTGGGSSSEPDPGVPSVPRNITASSAGNGKGVVTWAAPLENTRTLTRYLVRASKTKPVRVGGNWTMTAYIQTVVAASVTSAEITVPPPTADWYIGVLAENAKGPSPIAILWMEA